MNKPKNYDSVQAAVMGEQEVLEPGGYICKILKAEIKESSSGKEMMVINYDIAEGDRKDFFANKYRNNTNENKKWQGVYYQLTEDNSTKFFKGMITAIEKSNEGYKFKFDETTLKGKLFGGIFGREEYFNINTGKQQFSTKLLWIRNIDTIKSGNFETPADKLMNNNSVPSGFAHVDESLDDDDLPF